MHDEVKASAAASHSSRARNEFDEHVFRSGPLVLFAQTTLALLGWLGFASNRGEDDKNGTFARLCELAQL
jgi:hypothetical protein